MQNLPEQFIDRMKKRLGEGFPAFLRAYENPPYKGLRVNTQKISKEEFWAISPIMLEQVPWAENGFYITAEKAGAHPYHFAGLYYLQEPSAMCAAPMLEISAAKHVLDLCAAPGGKTTQIAARMDRGAILVANEIDGSRAKILSQNIERLGIANCAVTNATPKQLVENFPEYFDAILVDAPCSGEGMFKKEPNALTHWSPQNVALCAARQKEILDDAASMLTSGGEIVYSTCTFAEEEDEWQIADFLKRHPEFALLEIKKILPHEERGEGHFAARLKKISHSSLQREAPKIRAYPLRVNAQAEKAYRAFAEDFFVSAPQGAITTLSDGRMYLVPTGMPAFDVRVMRLGVELGEWDGKLIRPAHALAMAFGTHARRKVKLSLEEVKKYLRGETVEAEVENGWCVVFVEEFPLGLGKAVNGTVKNHLPKGLRLVRA